MTQDPFEDSKQRVKREKTQFALGIARVMNVPDGSGHEIRIKPLTEEAVPQSGSGEDWAPVIVPQLGDVQLPNEGDLVVFDRLADGDKVVLGTLYTRESSIRDYDAEERHVGREGGAGTFLHGPFVVAPSRTQDDSDATDGAVWYREDLDEYRGVEDGTVVSFDTTST